MAGLLGTDHLDSVGTSGILQGRLEEADHSSTNWYFPREELERTSPSLRDGIDTRRETYFRKSYCTFLQDLGMRLKVPQVTIATAITFCHRFYLRQSHAKNDRFMIATVCMFLAGKVEETPRVLKDVIIVSYTIRNKKDPTAANRIKQKEVYEAQKELVLYGERLVLTILGFDLNVHHPYRPLVAAIKKFKVAQHALAQVAWNFVNDGLRTSLCLQFKPHHIAAGAIFLAAKFLKVKLPNDGERPWWQEFDVTPKQLEEVSNQMLELYEQNRVVASRNEPNHDDANNGDKPDAASPAANGHHLALASSIEPKLDPPGEFDTRENGLASAAPPEPERFQQKLKEVPNGYDSRSRPEQLDKKRAPEQTDPAQQQQLQHHHHHQEEHKELEMAGDRLTQERVQQQESSKRKRESSDKKWSAKPEEGELPPPPSSRSDEYYHSRSSSGDKRYEDHRRDSQDYRYHSDHYNYHYQQRGDGDRSRTHSKDRDWQDRDPKKSRHKYS